METINFGKVIEDAVVGTQLIRLTGPVDNVVEEFGIWMNSRFSTGDTTYGMVFNTTRNALNCCKIDEATDWAIRKDYVGNPMIADGLVTGLLTALAQERLSSRASNARADSQDRSLREFKANAQSTLHDWVEDQCIIDDDDKAKAFNEVMEAIGLEGLKREFVVNVRVSYDAQISVSAISADAARDEVGDNLSDYLCDVVDVGYYDDYEFGDVEEA